jgi:23S rRNA (cytosine1962-C5)-methyltransferase
MIEIRTRRQYDEKYKVGFPLLLTTFVYEEGWFYKEGAEFVLLDHKDHFIGRGYLGKQNKGIGRRAELFSWNYNLRFYRPVFS